MIKKYTCNKQIIFIHNLKLYTHKYWATPIQIHIYKSQHSGKGKKLLIVTTTIVVRGGLDTDSSVDVDGGRTIVLVGEVSIDVESPEPMVIDLVVVGKPNPAASDVLDAAGPVSDTAGSVELI